jgi:pimeloyl-ACP methyl ester carboxylesterase
MLLVTGMAGQMIHWEPDFCDQLASRGFRVIRFDNRDAGLSTKCAGDGTLPAYSLDDMADDTVGLLDALDIPAAHLVGVSLGGMIAQLVTIRNPERVLSLCSISSTTGAPDVGQPAPGYFRARLAAPTTRDEAVERALSRIADNAGSRFPPDPARVARVAGEAWDRDHDPGGLARTWAAIRASGDRTERLAGIRVPTVVIHGDEDQAIGVSGGEATARAVPDARLLVIRGMGHGVPDPAWPQILDAIEANARAAAPA